MKTKVKVFSTPNCPFCILAKDFLKSHNIPFEDIDVQDDREAAIYMIEKTGQMGVPVIEINGKFIIGFDKVALKKELKIE